MFNSFFYVYQRVFTSLGHHMVRQASRPLAADNAVDLPGAPAPGVSVLVPWGPWNIKIDNMDVSQNGGTPKSSVSWDFPLLSIHWGVPPPFMQSPT